MPSYRSLLHAIDLSSFLGLTSKLSKLSRRIMILRAVKLFVGSIVDTFVTILIDCSRFR
jgi:chemotaxis signal transduction protein